MPNHLFTNTKLINPRQIQVSQFEAKSSQAAAKKSFQEIMKNIGLVAPKEACKFITSHFPYPAQRPFTINTPTGKFMFALDMGHRPGHAFVKISFPSQSKPSIETRITEVMRVPQ
jgi:hypothetical protein